MENRSGSLIKRREREILEALPLKSLYFFTDLEISRIFKIKDTTVSAIMFAKRDLDNGLYSNWETNQLTLQSDGSWMNSIERKFLKSINN